MKIPTDSMAKKHSIESRFRNISVVLFIAMLICLIVVVQFIIGNITDTASKDYARFYSTETVEKFHAYLNREVSLVTKVARSKALVEWFGDEDDPVKQTSAYEEMISYADMLYSANLYFVIADSQNEYSIERGASLEDFEPFDKVSEDVEYDRWYFDCIAANSEYLLNVDIDKVTNERRLWINHKVNHDGELVGVFCSGLRFDEVIDNLFMNYEAGKVRGVVINEDGFIQMDSTLSAEEYLWLYEEGLLLQDMDTDPAFLTYMDEYLGNIDGVFTARNEPLILELRTGEYGYVSLAPVVGTGWTVVTFFNSASLFGADKLLPLLITIVAALIVVAILITLLCRGMIFVPLRKLTRDLNLAGTNKDGRIYGHDLQNEFGDVSRTIQNMRTRLAAQNEALSAAVENAEKASQVKSRFIANMSHEMRTPMNVVVGLTDLMLDENNTPGNIKGTLKKINTAGNTLMGLINDVLDISKIEAGKLELLPVQYDTASVVNDLITLNMIRIGNKAVKFVIDVKEDLPQSLFGDDLRIKQILNNLLSNAFKYTSSGAVTLGIDSRREGEHVWVSFSVSDTGVGIKEEDIARLFTDYNQVDARANRKIEGTGLGLSITKRLVELMDGEITVESEYGTGTTFRVRVRQGFVSDAILGKEVAESLQNFRYLDNRRSHIKLARLDMSYARVLLVDDFPTNLDVAAGMLRKYKMQVDCVDSGRAAVDRIAAGEPAYDAVFMDHMMPEMDGMEAMETIRALGTSYAENIPIIALTANAIAGNEQMFLEKGFNAFIPKPINMRKLDAVVQRWVRDKSME